MANHRTSFVLAMMFSVFGTTAFADTLIPNIQSTKILPEASVEACASAQVDTVYGAGDTPLAQLCHRSYKACMLDGGCEIVTADKKTMMIAYENYDEQKNRSYFSVVDTDRCPYGLGVRNVCTDPYYSVAADRTQAKLGDVIFVPALVGIVLPGGEKHTGYLIVRDFASANEGSVHGVMDIQVGPRDPSAPPTVLEKMGFDLGNKAHFEYRNVTGDEALAVLKSRNFPLIPSSHAKKGK